jgi:rubrerythrin
MKTRRDAIVNFVEAELAARDFYLVLGYTSSNPEVRTLAREFVTEEERHRQLLLEWLIQSQDPALWGVHEEVRHLCEEPSREATGRHVGERANPAQVFHPWRVLELAIVRELDIILALLHLHPHVHDRLGRRMLLHLHQAKEQRKLLLEEQLRKLREQERLAA